MSRRTGPGPLVFKLLSTIVFNIWHTRWKLFTFLHKKKLWQKLCTPGCFWNIFLFTPLKFFSSFHTTMRISHYKLFSIYIVIVCKQGRIQDLWLGGAWVGEGFEDRLRSPAGPRQSPGRGHRGAKPLGSSGGLRNYRHLFEWQFWTNHTIFIKPKKLDLNLS